MIDKVIVSFLLFLSIFISFWLLDRQISTNIDIHIVQDEEGIVQNIKMSEWDRTDGKKDPFHAREYIRIVSSAHP